VVRNEIFLRKKHNASRHFSIFAKNRKFPSIFVEKKIFNPKTSTDKKFQKKCQN